MQPQTDPQLLIVDMLKGEMKSLNVGLRLYGRSRWTRRERARLTRLLDELVDVNNLILKLHEGTQD